MAAKRPFFTIDLASDFVHSRAISGAIWVIIPAVFAMLFAAGSMQFQDLPSSDQRPASILIFNQPTVGSMVIGRAMQSPLKVLVSNKAGYPIVNISLTAAVKNTAPSADYEWCMLHRAGTLEAQTVQEICGLELKGATARTDVDGVATFNALLVNRGVPGTLRLRIALDWCEDGKCSSRAAELQEKGLQDAFRVQIESYTDLIVQPSPTNLRAVNTAPAWIYIGEPMGSSASAEPQARVTDALGRPVAGVPVVAFTPHDLSLFFRQSRPRLVSFGADRELAGRDVPRLGVLTDATATTDSDGVARFDKLTLTATSSRSFVLAFYAGGNFDLWNEVLASVGPPAAAQSPSSACADRNHAHASRRAQLLVREVTVLDTEDTTRGQSGPSLHPIRAVPPDAAKERAWETRGRSMEGQIMGTVAVTVGYPVETPTNIRVNPVAGKRVLAVASPYYSKEQEEEAVVSVGAELAAKAMLESRRWRSFKHLVRAVSSPSDMNGVAVFTDMAFTARGAAGVYRIRFFVSGVEDPAVYLWEVSTSVRSISLNTSVLLQRAEGTQSQYGCIQEDGVLGCVQVGRKMRLPPSAFPSSDAARDQKYEDVALCSAQDLRTAWMIQHELIPPQLQDVRSRAIADLAYAQRSDVQLLCRQAPTLSLLAGGQFGSGGDDRTTRGQARVIVWVRDGEGRGLEGKSVHLWVRPDKRGGGGGKEGTTMFDETVQYQPGNPRVGVRTAALHELGGGAYVFDDKAGEGGEGGPFGSPFLWGAFSNVLPGGDDGRYLGCLEGAPQCHLCKNCSNAPFEYTFTVDGTRSSAEITLPFRRAALEGSRRTREIAEESCGSPAGNESNVSTHGVESLCAQVLVVKPLAAEITCGEALGDVIGRVVNASGDPISHAEVCLGWDHIGDNVDSLSPLLSALQALNPVAAGVHAPCLLNCSSAHNYSADLACLRACQVAASATSNGFCNITDGSGETILRPAPLPYPIGMIRWRLFVRDPFDDDLFPRSAAAKHAQCLRQRFGRTVAHPPDPLACSDAGVEAYKGRGGAAALCRSGDFYSRVLQGARVRAVNESSLQPDSDQISPRAFPLEPLLVRPGAAASLDIHIAKTSTGLGVPRSVTHVHVIAVPSLPVLRRAQGLWPSDTVPQVSSTTSDQGLNAITGQEPAASWSINERLLTASAANVVCFDGLGCNKPKALTDPGFARVVFQTDPHFIGSYYLCIDAHTLCFEVRALPVVTASNCPTGRFTEAGVARVLLAPSLIPCPSEVNVTAGNIEWLVDPVSALAPEFMTNQGGHKVALLSVGASFGLGGALLLHGAAGDFLPGVRVKMYVLERSISAGLSSAWEKSGRVLLRGEWSMLSNASGVAPMSTAFGVDWLSFPAAPSSQSWHFSLVACLTDADDMSILCSHPSTRFQLLWGDPLLRRSALQHQAADSAIRFLLQPPPLVSPGGAFAAPQDAVTDAVTSAGEVRVLPALQAHNAGMEHWRPPSLQLLARRADGVTNCSSEVPTHSLTVTISPTQGSNAEGSRPTPVSIAACNVYGNFSWQQTGNSAVWHASLELGACTNGVYQLVVRAVPDDDVSAKQFFFPSLPSHRQHCLHRPWALQQRSLLPFSHSTTPSSSDTCAPSWKDSIDDLGWKGTGTPDECKGYSTHSRNFNVASHGVFRLEVVEQPPEVLETLVPAKTSVRLTGISETVLAGVRVSCWLQEEAVAWPGVTDAAFDAGGYPGQFGPRRNVSAVTDENGIAHFSLTIVRADPSYRIRLLFTAFPISDSPDHHDLVAAEASLSGVRGEGGWKADSVRGRVGEIAMAVAHSRYFAIRHHFAEFKLVRALTFDEEVTDFVTTPLGEMMFTDGGGEATMRGNLGRPGKPKPDHSQMDNSSYKLAVSKSPAVMRILSLVVTHDAEIDAAHIVPPVVRVTDHEGQFVNGLSQVCKAAGCFNHVTRENFKKDVIQLRIRYYLLNTNGSLVDAVIVLRVQDPIFGGAAAKPGYWWLASRFEAWLPSGFYRPVFELDGLWFVQRQQIWIQNNRGANVGNVFPIEAPTFHYYYCLLTCLFVPVFSRAMSPEATWKIRILATILSVTASTNVIFYVNLYPPCEPEIANPLGCTNLNWDPAVIVDFPQTIWMYVFSNACVAILLYVSVGLFYYNFLVASPPEPTAVPLTPEQDKSVAVPETSQKDVDSDNQRSVGRMQKAPRRGGPLLGLLSEFMTSDFRKLKNAQARRLMLRLLLPPKATTALDEFHDRENLKGVPEPRAPELWWEGVEPSEAHLRRQRVVNAVYSLAARVVSVRNRLNSFYWRRLYPSLPLNSKRFEQLTDFKFPQRIFLASVAGLALLLVLQLVMAFQFNRVASWLELGRPRLMAELARLNRYALEFSLARSLVGDGRLPYNVAQWHIGRPEFALSGDGGELQQAEVNQLADMFPFLNTCSGTQVPAARSYGPISDIHEIPAALSVECLLRQFSLRIFARDNSSALPLSDRARERLRSATDARISAREIGAELLLAVMRSMTFAVGAAFVLTLIALTALALAYRSDLLKARRGRFPALAHVWRAPLPTAAASFVGSQTYGLLLGWLVYLCAAFALSFAVAWRPLRTFMIARLWLPVVLVSSLWAGALIFGFVASRASWSPIRVKPGYMRGTFLVAQRGWWGLYECMALFIYVVAGAFQTLMQLAVAVLHQYVRVSRLDLPTFSGHAGDDTISDSGHAGYKSMLLADHILNSPIINVAVRSLERELQRRRFCQQPVNDVIAMIQKSTGAMLEVTEVEDDKKQLRLRRSARMPLVRWQLSVMQLAYANANRGLREASITRQRLSQVDKGTEKEKSQPVLMARVGTADAERKNLGEETQFKTMGRRLRFGVFLPLPGHVGSGDKATVWDEQDVNAHVRFPSSFASLDTTPS